MRFIFGSINFIWAVTLIAAFAGTGPIDASLALILFTLIATLIGSAYFLCVDFIKGE